MESRTFHTVDEDPSAVEHRGVQRDAAEPLQVVGDPVAAELEATLAPRRCRSEIEGKVEALIAFLTARDIELDSATRERILGERDPQRVDHWIARAAISTAIAEVLADE